MQRRTLALLWLHGLFLPAIALAGGTNVVLNKPVVASAEFGSNIGEHAVDGDLTSRWENRARNRIAQLEIDLQGTFLLDSAEIHTGVGSSHAPDFVQLQYHDGFCWLPIPGATVDANPASNQVLTWTFTVPVVAERLRYHSLDTANNLLRELQVYGEPTSQSPVAPAGGCAVDEHAAVRAPSYNHALHLPPDYNLDAARTWPLIVSLHGVGGQILEPVANLSVLGNPEGFARQIENNPALADFAAIVASPQCRSIGQTGNCWFDNGRTLALIDDLASGLLVDPDRVILTGLSGGAIVSYRLGVVAHQRFAGLVPIAGQFPGGLLDQRCNLKRLHIWAFAGTADGSFPPSNNDQVRDHLDAHCPPLDMSYMTSTAIQGGTHSGSTWDVAYARPDLHAWMLEVVRVDAVTDNEPPLALAGSDLLVVLPQSSFEVVGSGTDDDGSIVAHGWTQLAGPTAVADPGTATLTVPSPAVGRYRFRLTVTDNLGATDDDDVTVIVVAAEDLVFADGVESGDLGAWSTEP